MSSCQKSETKCGGFVPKDQAMLNITSVQGSAHDARTSTGSQAHWGNSSLSLNGVLKTRQETSVRLHQKLVAKRTAYRQLKACGFSSNAAKFILTREDCASVEALQASISVRAEASASQEISAMVESTFESMDQICSLIESESSICIKFSEQHIDDKMQITQAEASFKHLDTEVVNASKDRTFDAKAAFALIAKRFQSLEGEFTAAAETACASKIVPVGWNVQSMLTIFQKAIIAKKAELNQRMEQYAAMSVNFYAALREEVQAVLTFTAHKEEHDRVSHTKTHSSGGNLNYKNAKFAIGGLGNKCFGGANFLASENIL